MVTAPRAAGEQQPSGSAVLQPQAAPSHCGPAAVIRGTTPIPTIGGPQRRAWSTRERAGRELAATVTRAAATAKVAAGAGASSVPLDVVNPNPSVGPRPSAVHRSGLRAGFTASASTNATVSGLTSLHTKTLTASTLPGSNFKVGLATATGLFRHEDAAESVGPHWLDADEQQQW